MRHVTTDMVWWSESSRLDFLWAPPLCHCHLQSSAQWRAFWGTDSVWLPKEEKVRL